jgi:acyl-coenzyme A thioesterase PaaI-like protein
MTETIDQPAGEPRPAPEGWVLQHRRANFAWHAGPYYFRAEGPTPGVAFYSEPHHGNAADAVHGGALLTLADMALFDAAFRKVGRFRAVTLTLTSEFLAPAPIGAFIEAAGEVIGGGRKIIILRGLVSSAGAPLMSFSGTLRRFE